MKNSVKSILVKEDFLPVDVKFLDSKHRIMLGDKVTKLLLGRMKVDAFQILVGRQGDVLLRPTAHVPSREAWLYQSPAALAKVRKGLAEAKAKNTEKVTDLEKFLDNL